MVDLRGIPVDFRYTDPIRPSRLERILYGSALDVYLREELILQSLLGAVETTPSLWVCSEGDLLAPLKAAGKGRAIFLAPSAHAPLEAAGAVEPTGEAEVLLIQADSVKGGFQFRAWYNRASGHVMQQLYPDVFLRCVILSNKNINHHQQVGL